MDIDGYDGSQLAEIDSSILHQSAAIDNSATANMNAMFDITRMSGDVNKIDMNLVPNNETMVGTFPQNLESMSDQDDDNEDDGDGSDDLIENIENQQNNDKVTKKTLVGLSFFFIFIIIWALLGIAAFIASLVCFGFSGSMVEKILGLLLALFLGPFYWLYFYFNKSYCGKN